MIQSIPENADNFRQLMESRLSISSRRLDYAYWAAANSCLGYSKASSGTQGRLAGPRFSLDFSRS
jgi:hypothetical protein